MCKLTVGKDKGELRDGCCASDYGIFCIILEKLACGSCRKFIILLYYSKRHLHETKYRKLTWTKSHSCTILLRCWSVTNPYSKIKQKPKILSSYCCGSPYHLLSVHLCSIWLLNILSIVSGKELISWYKRKKSQGNRRKCSERIFKISKLRERRRRIILDWPMRINMIFNDYQ